MVKLFQILMLAGALALTGALASADSSSKKKESVHKKQQKVRAHVELKFEPPVWAVHHQGKKLEILSATGRVRRLLDTLAHNASHQCEILAIVKKQGLHVKGLRDCRGIADNASLY